ncbi:MAG: glutathione S-transferase family protein [Pseudomonadota bacterium]
MEELVLYGATYSVYTRIPLIVLEEAGATYRLEHTDIFSQSSLPTDYLERHPFKKIPLLRHGSFELFETDAIVEYLIAQLAVDLVPEDDRRRARMRQIMRIADNYAYPSLIWQLYVQEHEEGKTLTLDQIDGIETVLTALEHLVEGEVFLSGQFTLADCWLVPMMDYALMTERGRDLITNYPQLARWWRGMQARPAVNKTAFPQQ